MLRVEAVHFNNSSSLDRANGRGTFGSQTAADPPGPRRTPEKQTVGTVTASPKMLNLQALSSSLNVGTAKRGCLGRGEALDDLRQSVPQNGRVHLHIIDPGVPDSPQHYTANV